MNKIERQYFPNGNIQFEDITLNGKRHGRQRVFHKNGTMNLEYHMIHGKFQGLRVDYHLNGTIRFIDTMNSSIEKDQETGVVITLKYQ